MAAVLCAQAMRSAVGRASNGSDEVVVRARAGAEALLGGIDCERRGSHGRGDLRSPLASELGVSTSPVMVEQRRA